MKKLFLVLFWIVLSFVLNIFGRYFYVTFFKDGYYWLAYFYLEIAGTIASLISILLFFTINYFINKKRKIKQTYAITVVRLLLMLFVVMVIFVGERVYITYYDYLIFKN